jgi:uncharacterized phosphosugar-binding protein
MLTPDERAILATELSNDPLGRGYAAMSNAEVVDSLRNVLDRSRTRSRMDSSEVFQAIDIAEFNAKTDLQQRNVMAVLSFGSVNPQGKEAALFTNIFGAGSATITALAAARLESISRSVELGIPNVYEMDVVAVRGS